jgi:hypothetical protein
MHGPPLYGGSGSGGPYGHAYNGHAFAGGVAYGGGAYGGNAYGGTAFSGGGGGGAMATPPGPLAPVQTHRSAASSRASTPLAAEGRVLLEPHAPHSLGSLVLGPGDRRLSSGTSSGNGSGNGGGPGSSSGHGGGISLHGVLGGLGAPTTLAALTHGGDDDDGGDDGENDDAAASGAPPFSATTTPSPWSHTAGPAGSAGLVGAGASSRQAQALVHAQASAAALEAPRSSGKPPRPH